MRLLVIQPVLHQPGFSARPVRCVPKALHVGRPRPQRPKQGASGAPRERCAAGNVDRTADSPQSPPPAPHARAGVVGSIRAGMERSTDILPYAVVAAAGLALFYPPSFFWFTPNMYAPALGFLMFAVGVNLDPASFARVFRSPKHLLVGIVGQWLVKPLLGVAVSATLIPLMGLPPSVGTGIVLVSCVSGAQLSNYATFLVHPEQAPLSIVLTALSTLCGAVLTPALVLLLLGRRVPIDAPRIAASICQVVIAPVAAGLLCNKFAPRLVRLLKPVVVFASLVDTCACVGASLSSNATAARSVLGLQVLFPVLVFHTAAFVCGHKVAERTVAHDSKGLARCISLETGMQSSLLALLLSTKFFQDSLVSLPCGISVIVMTLSGFALVVYWQRRDARKTADLQPS